MKTNFKLLLLAVATVLSALVLQPNIKASAASLVTNGVCSGSPADFDWPSWVKQSITTFDNRKSSYIIFQDSPTYASAHGSNLFTIYISSVDTKPLIITGDTYAGYYGGGPGLVMHQTASSIDSMPIVDYNYTPNPISPSAKQQYAGPSFSVLSYPSPLTGYPFSSLQVGCVVGAHNVTYSNFPYDKFPDASAYTSGVGGAAGTTTVCDPLDIGCKLANVFSSVSDTVKDIALAAVQAIGDFFIPDTDAIKNDISAMSTSFTTTLGFIAYPITFIVDAMNAFLFTPSSCNTSSCLLNPGTLFGQSWNIDFAQLARTMPTAWNTLTVIARGSLVITVILGIFAKAKRLTRS